ncbi:MAG: hypothetical protein U0837_00675 [Dehalococcoidia bacterium]
MTSTGWPRSRIRLSTTSYAFDAFGNRTSTTVAGNTTTYAYDDNDRITSDAAQPGLGHQLHLGR